MTMDILSAGANGEVAPAGGGEGAVVDVRHLAYQLLHVADLRPRDAELCHVRVETHRLKHGKQPLHFLRKMSQNWGQDFAFLRLINT